jgi:hypothetical protein
MVPREAHIVTREGEHVPCLIEQTGPKRWLAVPVRKISVDEAPLSGYVDVIPAGGTVGFLFEPREGDE